MGAVNVTGVFRAQIVAIGTGLMAMRDQDEWRKLLELAHEAADLSPEARVPFLHAKQCSQEQIDQVLDLIGEFDHADSVLTYPAGRGRDTDQTPSRIGRFEVKQLLGQGGMGKVYSAWDPELRRTVAIKLLHTSSGRRSSADRAIREARFASALSHPRIATVYEVIRCEDGEVAIIMEFLSGQPLRSLLNREPVKLDAQQIRSVAAQVADALSVAHGAGIIHCDIKPENIVVGEDGQTKVLDFGLARRSHPTLGSSSSIEGFGGSWRYMAPEQCRGEVASSASDMFALGLVLYEMYAGEHPFPSDSAVQTMSLILSSPTPAPVKWRVEPLPRIRELIFALLEKDPAKRPTASEVRREFELDPATVLPARRFARPIQLALVAVLILAVVGIRYYLGSRKELSFSQLTTLIAENHCTAAAISPRADALAYATGDGMFLKALATAEISPLASPPDFWVEKIAWFPDGSRLVISGYTGLTNTPNVLLVFLDGQAPRLLRENARSAVVAPDGLRIAFTSGDATSIWVMGSAGNDPAQIVPARETDRFPFVLWSGKGTRLGFQRRSFRAQGDLGYVMQDQYYTRTYETVSIPDGSILSRRDDIWIESAAETSDGRLLYLQFDSPGSNECREVIEVPVDAATGGLEGEPKILYQPRLRDQALRIFGLTLSADNRQLVVLNNTSDAAIFVGDFQKSEPSITNLRRITLNTALNFPDLWTAASDGLIFESDLTGRWNLYRQSLTDRYARPLFKMFNWHYVMAQLAPDGQSMLFTAFPVQAAPNANGPPARHIYWAPLEGGTVKEVPLTAPWDEFRCSTGTPRRCVIRQSVSRESFRFFALDPEKGRGMELAKTAWQEQVLGDWALSPDGKTIAIPNHDSRSAILRLVSLTGGSESNVELQNLSQITGIAWSADGAGWFVTTQTSIGGRMAFATPDGKTRILGNFLGTALPSPDGKQVAIRDRRTPVNAWGLKLK